MAYSEPWEPLLAAARRMKSAWPTRGWTWDGRLSCVASSFSVQYEAAARTAMGSLLTESYTSTTLPKASSRLRDVAERSGGLRAGQLLLAGGPYGYTHAYGLWWPWGNGETISLRVGLVDIDAMREPFPAFRDAMGVTLY